MRRFLAVLAVILAAAGPASADDRLIVVTMEPGRYSRQVADKVTGLDTVTYAVSAAAGQTVAFTFETNHRQSRMDVFAPDGARLHDGTRGLSWTGVATRSGQFSARILLADRPARQGETATYRITVAVTGEPAEGAPPAPVLAAPAPTATPAPQAAAPAEAVPPGAAAAVPGSGPAEPTAGADGGPAAAAPLSDAEIAAEAEAAAEAAAQAVAPGGEVQGAAKFWAVAGVPPGGVLPVYKEPGVEASRIGKLTHDAAGLPNLGCRMEGGARWCRVRLDGQVEQEGWVSGRYLRETSGEDDGEQAVAVIGVRPLRNLTGVVACGQGSQPKPNSMCEARVQRAGPGLAVVYATLPDGATRVINFAADRVFVTNPDLVLEWQRKGASYEVRINGRELFVIPAQVIGDG